MSLSLYDLLIINNKDLLTNIKQHKIVNLTIEQLHKKQLIQFLPKFYENKQYNTIKDMYYLLSSQIKSNLDKKNLESLIIKISVLNNHIFYLIKSSDTQKYIKKNLIKEFPHLNEDSITLIINIDPDFIKQEILSIKQHSDYIQQRLKINNINHNSENNEDTEDENKKIEDFFIF